MSSQIKGVIFDFNGTLFWDAAFHDAAWSDFGKRHGVSLTPAEFERQVIGFANKEILAYIYGGKLSEEEVERYSLEKERLYREACRSHPDRCVLAPGAEAFLDFLKAQGVARTIASASIVDNMRFFYETFDLGRWFVFEQFAYDDGALRGKPFPDMFLAAAARIRVPIERCMVIEDSVAGVKGALNAGAGHVAGIVPAGAENKLGGISGVHHIVSDFTEIDRTVFGEGQGEGLTPPGRSRSRSR